MLRKRWKEDCSQEEEKEDPHLRWMDDDVVDLRVMKIK
jgi:hypothetical protein